MGGFGSGRPGWHNKVEQSRSLDVNWLHRAGCLKPGWMPFWSRDNQSNRRDLAVQRLPLQETQENGDGRNFAVIFLRSVCLNHYV